jgi:hypothetical protein
MSDQNGLISPLVLAGLLILALIGAGVVLQTQTPRVQTNMPNPTPKPTISSTMPPTPSQTTLKTTNPTTWETYTSADNYSLSLPPSTLIQKIDRSYSNITSNRVTTMSYSHSSTTPNIKDWYALEITIEDNTSNQTADQLMQSYITSARSKSNSATEFARIQGSLKPYHNNNIDGAYAILGSDYLYYTIIQTKNNRIYSFVTVGPNATKVSDTANNEVQQILATFQVLNQQR